MDRRRPLALSRCALQSTHPAACRGRAPLVGPMLPLLLTACVASGGNAVEAALETAPPADPVDRVAYAALVAGTTEWREPKGGATGTVEATGQADAAGCRPARLTIHDFTGLRIEERRLCPPPFGP